MQGRTHVPAPQFVLLNSSQQLNRESLIDDVPQTVNSTASIALRFQKAFQNESSNVSSDCFTRQAETFSREASKIGGMLRSVLQDEFTYRQI